jgi:predicted AlkP superfamily pyrophosphatase or phosphodiesterase
MYSSADWSVTPRPHYPSDGSKVFDVYTHPIGMRDEMFGVLGPFPFPAFWGPMASIASSRWIAESAKWIFERHRPTLNLVYLPHLDYGLQMYGPGSRRMESELRAIDEVVGDLIDFYERRGVRVLVVSEYGITPVHRCVHPNRILREAGLVTVRPSLGRELLDCGASEAFAVSDHQICHVYVRNPDRLGQVARLFEGVDGVREVLVGKRIRELGLDHPRSGELILMADSDAWFTYYYWLDDALAPDFARCVDIHRKPGYDPVELFLDPDLRFPKLKVAWTLLKKTLGFRYRMEVIPLEPELVQGSHGTPVSDPDGGPIAISRHLEARAERESIPIEGVHDLILRHVID